MTKFLIKEKKIYNKKVSYGEVLHLPVISEVDSNQINLVPYILYGVIVHSGSTCTSGHYYAYARSCQMQGDEPNLWYKLNDSSVGVSSFFSFSSITDSLSSDVAYMLFYVKPGYIVDLKVEILNEINNSVLSENVNVEQEEQRKETVKKKITQSYSNYAGFRHYDNGGNGFGGGGFDGFGGDGFGGGGFGGWIC